MLVIKKLVSRLSIIGILTLLAHNIAQAKNKPISLQEAINIALKNNLSIQIAQNDKKQAIIANRIANFRLWAPRATLRLYQENRWESHTTNHHIQSMPVFRFKWQLTSLVDKIFQTKIHCQNNVIHKLVAKKSVEKELQQVVTAYYELALAQKKWELSNTLIKAAAARLNIEEEKFRLGIISKIDCLDAQLALKEIKLTLLERQEALQAKRRCLNRILDKPLTEETLVQSNISVQPIWDMTTITKEKVVDLETAIQVKKVAIAATELNRVRTPLSCLSLSGSFDSKGYIYNFKEAIWTSDKQSNKWLANIGVSIDMVRLLLMPATIKKAKIGLNNAKLALQQQKLAIESGLEDKKWQYRHALGVYKVVEEQLKISKQKLIFVKEKYRLNQAKLLELHEAEEATQKIEIHLTEQAFKVKEAEFALYQLVGMFQKK
ncbi:MULTISPECIES: TolC family protein [unclassified Candidatus Cardinium]|uniref:TolC family protein n=1 Tax=unclassified Candidatus Cardinium TaxID=2641185 RepID=UPI001FB434B7|nr:MULTISPECIES: TolC family protein [unclassified Candidatus Cardinium]